MYTTKTFDEIVKEAYKYSGYKLCYVDDIGKYCWEFSKEDNQYVEKPNNDYIEGEQEYYAYFTPVSLDEQWGDDWDDYPYNENAGEPYDSSYKEKDANGEWKEYEIICVPFFLPSGVVYFAKDWGYDRGCFSVEDINAGAVAWIYYPSPLPKTSKGALVIKAGDNPMEFIEKVEKINSTAND